MLHTDQLRCDDFVGFRVLQHTILMDPGLVCVGITADDGFVARNRHAGKAADQIACALRFLQYHTHFFLIIIFADVERNCNFLKCRISCTLSDAVDGALYPKRAIFDCSQSVRRCHPQIVVAMGGENHLIKAGYILLQIFEQITEFGRISVANGIRNVDDRCALFDRQIDDFNQEIPIASGRILRRELDFLEF